MRSIIFFIDTGKTKMTSKFRSLKYLETFTKVKLSVNLRASRLKSVNNDYDNIVDSLEEIADSVNS